VCACVRAHFAFLAWAAAGVKDRPGEVKNRLLGPSAACPVPVAGNTTAQKLEPPTPSNPKKPISQKNPKTLPFFFFFGRECSGLSCHVKSVRQAAAYDTFAAGGDSRGAVTN
jgi:hypothetical protein